MLLPALPAAATLPALVDLTPSDTIPSVDPSLAWWPVAAVVVLIGMVNVAAHKSVPGLYMFWAAGGSVVVLAIAVLDGTTWMDLGLAPTTWVPGLVWGVGAIMAVYAVYEVGAHIPRMRKSFGDQRILGLPKWKVYFKALIELPFGTVLFEEIAFRGALWAMLARRMDWVHATWLTAIMFGLWHILGSLDLHERNPGFALHGKPVVAKLIATGGAVVTTAIGGLVFTGLRIASGSLLAPMGLHWATNGWGYLFARRIHVTGGKGPAADV